MAGPIHGLEQDGQNASQLEAKRQDLRSELPATCDI